MLVKRNTPAAPAETLQVAAQGNIKSNFSTSCKDMFTTFGFCYSVPRLGNYWHIIKRK